mgnify:CR=1 FL=1
MTPRYAELQVTSPFSFLRGASSAEELFAQAALHGIEALGIVDRNSLAGIVRAHEAAKLMLDDFDWKRERFQVRQRKAGHRTVYPLAAVIAEAIIDYLQHGRPQTTDRHLFFRVMAPRLPMTSAAVSSAVAKWVFRPNVTAHFG